MSESLPLGVQSRTVMRRTCARYFRAVCISAGIGRTGRRASWGTSVSLMSNSDVALEEIARLVGHVSSKVTETVYQHQRRPS
jgi:integrase